jgi:hypothetical protein
MDDQNIGQDPHTEFLQRRLLPKGVTHLRESVPAELAKPAFVKPGFGRNQDVAGKDAMPGFEGLNSYVSTTDKGNGYGQGAYPPASKD